MKRRFTREITNWKVLYTTFTVKLLFSYSLLQGIKSYKLRNIIHWEIQKGFLEHKTHSLELTSTVKYQHINTSAN